MQYFAGVVNGKMTRATIKMACFGPVRPGQKGHPMADQTMKIDFLGTAPPSAPPGALGDLGYTGPLGNEIGAFFGPLPPQPIASAAPVIFRTYGVAKAIPTALLLPCGGSGRVAFVPIPVAGGSQDAAVHVSFVGQP